VDINHLQTFCAVIEAGSITRAARELFVSQPSISMKIMELEQHYRIKLLERSNKGIIPTEAGLFLYQEGQKVLSLMGNVSREFEQRRSPEEELCVGASDSVGNFALPCTIFVFKEYRPYCNITLNVGNSAQVVDWVANRKVEVGLVEGPLDNVESLIAQGNISTRRIMSTELVLAVPNEEPYRDLESVTLDQFLAMPLIIREPGSGIRANLERVLSGRGLALSELQVTMELHAINAIVSAVSSGKGVSLLPEMVIRKELRYNILKSLRVDGVDFVHNITLLYYQNVKKEAYVAFIELLMSDERGFC
jgi:LysR family transcriptional regulator, transcriptional activator of the cysJI operon